MVLGTTSFWDDLTLLHVGQVPWSDLGFAADLEGGRGYQGEKGSKFVVGLQEGLWCYVRPGTQDSSLALRLYH